MEKSALEPTLEHGGSTTMRELAMKSRAQYAELTALEEALDSFTASWGQIEIQGICKLRIYSDCESALQALQNPQR